LDYRFASAQLASALSGLKPGIFAGGRAAGAIIRDKDARAERALIFFEPVAKVSPLIFFGHNIHS
jgi:hypothetical protein